MHTNVILTNKRRIHAQSNSTNTKLKAWFRRLLRHPARKRSASILHRYPHPRTQTGGGVASLRRRDDSVYIFDSLRWPIDDLQLINRNWKITAYKNDQRFTSFLEVNPTKNVTKKNKKKQECQPLLKAKYCPRVARRCMSDKHTLTVVLVYKSIYYYYYPHYSIALVWPSSIVVINVYKRFLFLDKKRVY